LGKENKEVISSVIIDNLDIDIRSLISLNSVMILNIFEVRGNPHPQPLSQVGRGEPD
jgi:hypothetical protein